MPHNQVVMNLVEFTSNWDFENVSIKNTNILIWYTSNKLWLGSIEQVILRVSTQYGKIVHLNTKHTWEVKVKLTTIFHCLVSQFKAK